MVGTSCNSKHAMDSWVCMVGVQQVDLISAVISPDVHNRKETMSHRKFQSALCGRPVE